MAICRSISGSIPIARRFTLTSSRVRSIEAKHSAIFVPRQVFIHWFRGAPQAQDLRECPHILDPVPVNVPVPGFSPEGCLGFS